MSERYTGPDPREDESGRREAVATLLVVVRRGICTSNRTADADAEKVTEDVRKLLFNSGYDVDVTSTEIE